MRNLKRVLALALALVMMLGMMITASAATYADEAAIAPEYADAVEILTGMGVFQGTGAGFAPKAILSRAEAAALIYRVISADVKDSKIDLYDYSSFDDVAEGEWYTGYVTYAANGDYIKGDGTGNFNPNDKVTGIQVLAIMLRAMGYGQKGEFEGAGWKDGVLTVADDLDILDNVNVKSLDVPASREIVAQLLFDAIQAPTTTYTPAFGYVDNWNLLSSNASLGWKNFGLKDADSEDVWGRPCTVWYDGRIGMVKGTYAVIEETPVYTNVVAVDECDVSKALGLKAPATIESVWVDAVEGMNYGGKIEPLNTRSVMGAQGRVLEIYDMGVAGYRVVEINTYLGEVTAVYPATTDKNGHTTKTTIDVKFYTGYANSAETTQTVYGVEAEGFFVRDDVLVNVANPGSYIATVEEIVATAPVAGGQMISFSNGYGTTPAVSVVGGTAYNEANKYFLNYREGGNWNIFIDAYGNLIGMTESRTNYLVIEAVRWIGDSTLYGGKAIANVVLADGTRVENVTIASVNNIPANHKSASAVGTPSAASFDTSYADNNAYYDHIVTYAVNADGTYAIGYANGKLCAGTDMTTNSGVITQGQTVMTDGTTYVGINDTTVFVVADYVNGQPTYTYTTYVGKQNVPSMTGAEVCYLKPANSNYASLVLVTEYDLATNTFAAYVDADAASTGYYYTGLGYVFNVYKVGETQPTIVYNATNSLNITKDGIYSFTVDAKGIMTGNAVVIPVGTTVNTSSQNTASGLTWDRNIIDSNDGNNMYAAADNTNTYWVDNAQYIVVNYAANGAMTFMKTAASYDEIVWNNTQVLVGYKTVANVKQAAYVYVIAPATTAGGLTPTTVTSINVYGAAPQAGVQLGALTSVDAAKVTFTAQWYDRTTGTFVDNTQIAIAGHDYTVVVTNVAAKPGYTLDTAFTVQGFTSTIAGTWTYNF